MPYTLTPKSQVTLPKAIREYLKVAPGDQVEFHVVADGTVRVAPARPARADKVPAAALARYRKLIGSGGRAGPSTDALMNLLRGYDEDAADPGFGGAAGAMPRVAAKRSR